MKSPVLSSNVPIDPDTKSYMCDNGFFRDITQCSLVSNDQCFKEAYCLHHERNELFMMEIVSPSEVLLISTILNSATSQMTCVFILIAVRTQNLTFIYVVFKWILLFVFMSMWRDYVSELQPLTGLYKYLQPGWNDIDRGKPVLVSFSPPRISQGLIRARTRASAVRGLRLSHGTDLVGCY
jgi:hypothetical protein